MLDVDHFKELNDRLGHPAGDQALSHIGQVLLRSIRVGDTAYRYGGDEFALLLPEADSATALNAAERIRQEVLSNMPTPESGTITVSEGVAVCPRDGTSPTELLSAADIALYKAKRAGRNCVEIAGAPYPVPTSF
jgi:diguanylate cyclase (GGDEF)-like protein